MKIPSDSQFLFVSVERKIDAVMYAPAAWSQFLVHENTTPKFEVRLFSFVKISPIFMIDDEDWQLVHFPCYSKYGCSY